MLGVTFIFIAFSGIRMGFSENVNSAQLETLLHVCWFVG
jgi:hypothetical protein